MKVEERLLKYVSVWTTSDEENDAITPSSNREWILAKLLEQELRDLGLSKVKLSEYCYVYGLLPATEGMENKKSIGLIAHMDTSPACSGRNVHPQIIPNYDGEDILLEGAGIYLRPSEFPTLSQLKGRTLITTDGTTLLGADDKAGIAEIITTIEYIIDQQIPHGDIWVAFTPDEEIGQGVMKFDLDYFKADYAYTSDGDYEGGITYENFNASSAAFHITGKNIHPGYATGIMINAALIAAEIVRMLPENETPATTSGREGFYHLVNMQGDVSEAELHYIIRDHDYASFEARQNYLRKVEALIKEKYGEQSVSLEITHTYSNMLSVIRNHMYTVDLAKDAIRAAGLTPVCSPVRGGTDGAHLSFQGLPCPNLGTGGYAFHGPYEHISVEGMETSVKILTYIVSHPIDK